MVVFFSAQDSGAVILEMEMWFSVVGRTESVVSFFRAMLMFSYKL